MNMNLIIKYKDFKGIEETCPNDGLLELLCNGDMQRIEVYEILSKDETRLVITFVRGMFRYKIHGEVTFNPFGVKK
jgi:hypothetical protein